MNLLSPSPYVVRRHHLRPTERVKRGLGKMGKKDEEEERVLEADMWVHYHRLRMERLLE